ncbi:MAG: hypothetical protein JXR64_12610 [Spirochaetales bacterium]|nr:hypothetical protein [Spirochaetales bacterium]
MRIKIIPNIILLFSVIIINLLYPFGRVLFYLGPLRITLESLLSGIQKGSLLIGLMYLSKNISISSIKIPGEVGLLIKDTFYYFNQFTQGDKVKFKTFITDIDNKLLALSNTKPVESEIIRKNRNNTLIIFSTTLILFILDLNPFNF